MLFNWLSQLSQMLSILALFFLLSFSYKAFSNEQKGIVCLGQNLAKAASEHSNRLYLKVGDSEKIYFVDPYNGPRITLKNLDLQKAHTVKVFYDDQVVQSWKLNFVELKTESVLIWRASGSWRMEPYDASLCK